MSIAGALAAQARARPDAVALHWPEVRRGLGGRRTSWHSLMFAALDRRVDAVAAGFAHAGLAPGTRAVVMIRPGCDFFVVMYALFRVGAVPVLIDPGLDRRALRQCLEEAAPTVFIGIGLAQLARRLFGWARATIRKTLWVGRRWWPSGITLAHVEQLGQHHPVPQSEQPADALAAVLFTSGSTGVPKGVCYTHAMFAAQVELLRTAFAIEPGGINLPTFPPFALFDAALGLSSVIPDMDPRHPARADPARLCATIEQFGCTLMFGSPALVDVLGRHGERTGQRLTTLRTVLSAGAPVAPERVRRMLALLPPGARLFTPYGATEALPVAVVEGQELLGEARARTETGAGICVGRPVSGNIVRIIAIRDEAVGHWSEVSECPNGTIGEITVRGPSVTQAYDARPAATALAKIRDYDGSIVHRMGDLGYVDSEGRLWFVGRKTERVQTTDGVYFTECLEQVCNLDPAVARSALVGVGSRPAQRPVVLIERAPGDDTPWPELTCRLRARLAVIPALAAIREFVAYPGRFPVDIRHNAKIGRAQLAAWATRQSDAP